MKENDVIKNAANVQLTWREIRSHNHPRGLSYWQWIVVWVKWQLGYYTFENIYDDILREEITAEINKEIITIMKDFFNERK